MAQRHVDIVTEPEVCERAGAGRIVAVTRRRDDGATRLSDIGRDGHVLPGGHNELYHRRDGRDAR